MTDVEDMTLMEKVEQIKRSVGPLDLAETLDMEVEDGKIHSPWNEADRTPSCHLYEDHFYDFSTGQGGDVIDLFMLLAKCSWGSAVNRLLKGALSMDADAGRIVRSAPVDVDLTDTALALPTDEDALGMWTRRLHPLSHEYLFGLWFQDCLAYTEEAMWIPHWNDGKVTGIKIRRTDGSKTAVLGSQFGKGLYKPMRQGLCQSSAIICEGESDCWAMDQFFDGQAWVCALPGGAGLWRAEWLAELEQFDRIYTCFDNDDAGRKATEKVRRSIGWGRAETLQVPQLSNDVREALAAGWVPRLK